MQQTNSKELEDQARIRRKCDQLGILQESERKQISAKCYFYKSVPVSEN